WEQAYNISAQVIVISGTLALIMPYISTPTSSELWQAKELSKQTFDQLIGNLSHQAESPHSKDLLVMINCQGGYQSSLTLVM
ncbi:hypothetical protein PROFUN_12034, partial [Planoprotostelium fungivorum]